VSTREEANAALLKLANLYGGYCEERWGKESDDSIELVAVVQAHMAALETARRWRSIKVELPLANQPVLWLSREGDQGVGRRVVPSAEPGSTVEWGEELRPVWHFTHWMPLPGVPTEDK
jgi:hypothetical protein